MKTIFIYDQCGQEPIGFFELEGDYSHLDRVYINDSEVDEEVENELIELLYGKGGKLKVELSLDFPLVQDQKIIVCGFLP